MLVYCTALYLILVARPLAVLAERLERLLDEADVVLVDVEAEKPEAARRAAADAVEELERFAHQIERTLVALRPQIVLQCN